MELELEVTSLCQEGLAISFMCALQFYQIPVRKPCEALELVFSSHPN